MDTTTSLFEHIKNRMEPGYEYGDDNKIVDEELIANHQTSQQSLREDFEGDVGIFETQITQESLYMGVKCNIAKIQIAVVTKDGNIENAKEYLMKSYNNLKKNQKSSGIYVKNCELVSLLPLGKNSKGLQMVSMNVSLKYITLQ
jgi:hypothetical protein